MPSKRTVLRTFILGLCIVLHYTPAAAWWDAQWKMREVLTIDTTQIHAELDSFPALVMLHGGNIDYSRIRDNGEDIRFIDEDDNTEIPYEIEQWDEAGTSYVWVEIPRINGTGPDSIFLYFGNGSVADGQQGTEVWDGGAYSGVWHLNETMTDEATGGIHQDATSHNRDGVQWRGDDVRGVVAAGQYLDGSGDYINLWTSNWNIPATGEYTVSLWFKIITLPGDSRAIIKKSDYVRPFVIRTYSTDNNLSTYIRNDTGTQWFNDGPELVAGEWCYVTLTYSTATDRHRVYLNKTREADQGFTGTSILSSADTTFIGRGIDIVVDEVRIQNTVRDSGWVVAQYNSMRGDLFGFSDVEFLDSLPPDNDMTLTAAGTGKYSVEVRWNPATVDSVDAAGTGIWYKTGSYPSGPGDTTATLAGYYSMSDAEAVITGLSPTSTYYFIISARDTAWNWSTVTGGARDTAVTATDTSGPDNDMTLTATTLSYFDIGLSWNPGYVDSADAESVVVWYRTDGYPGTGGVNAETRGFSMAESTATITGLLGNTEYYFTLAVRDTGGNWSDPVHVMGWTDTLCYLFLDNGASPDTIWKTGLGRSPDTSTVTLRINAYGNMVNINLPLDVVLLTDNSGSMETREIGDRDVTDPSRIQGTYNSCVNFVDSCLDANDRVAHMRLCGIIDTPLDFTDDFGFAQATMDTNIDGKEMVDGIRFQGTAIWTGIADAIRYAMYNRRPGGVPIIIALTDGDDNASGSYGEYWQSGYPNLGSTQQDAVDSVLSVINAYGDSVKVFTINLGTTSNQAFMQQIADAGNGKWAYSETGGDLDYIFQDIGERLLQTAALEISSDSAMITDVLPPYIEYTGTWSETDDNTVTIDSFSAVSIDSFTEVRFFVNQINIDDTFEVTYDIVSTMPGTQTINFGSGSVNPLGRYSAVRYRDYSRQQVITDTFKTRSIFVAEALVYDAVRITGTEVLDHERVRLIIDTSYFHTMAVDSVLLYHSSTSWPLNLVAPHITVPAHEILAAGGTYTFTSLAETTLYYFTAAVRNFVNDISTLAAARGDTATTGFHYPHRLKIITDSNGDINTGVDGASVTADTVLPLYAAGYDSTGAFIRNYSVHWRAAGILSIYQNYRSTINLSPALVGSDRVVVFLPQDNTITDTASISVTVGEFSHVHLHDSINVTGRVAEQTVGTDGILKLWCGVYDADGNWIRDTSAAWSTDGGLLATDLSSTTGSKIVYDPSTPGVGYIKAVLSSSIRDSVKVTVLAGAIASVKIRTAAGGAGQQLHDTLTLVAGYADTFYLAGYDDDGSYMGDISGIWSSIEDAPVFIYASGVQAFFECIPLIAGRGRLVAEYNGKRDTTGMITVIGAEPDTVIITAFPAQVTAGEYFNNISIEVRDALGNYTDYETDGIIWQAYDTDDSYYGYPVEYPDSSQHFVGGKLDSTNLEGRFRLVTTGSNRIRIGIIIGGDTLWSGYSPQIAVVPGTGFRVEIRNSELATQPLATDVSTTTDDSLHLYAGLYDSLGNYVGDQPVAWSSDNLFPALAATEESAVSYRVDHTGSGSIIISHTTYIGDTLTISASHGVIYGFHLTVKGRSGDTVATGENFIITVVAHDEGGNTVTDYQGEHTLAWDWLTPAQYDSIEGDSAQLSPDAIHVFAAGTTNVSGFTMVRVDTVVLEVTEYGSNVSGRIVLQVVDGTGPMLISGYYLDTDGDGYLDSVVGIFNEDLETDTVISGSGGFSIQGENTYALTRVRQDRLARTTEIRTGNSAAVNVDREARLGQDTQGIKTLFYDGGGFVRDTYGNPAAVSAVSINDSAGPVLHAVSCDNNLTETDLSDDRLTIMLSEPAVPPDGVWTGKPISSIFRLAGFGRFGSDARLIRRQEDQLFVVSLGTDTGAAVVPGYDSLYLVPGALVDKAGNPSALNNRGMVVSMTTSQHLIMEISSYPSPCRVGAAGFWENGALDQGQINSIKGGNTPPLGALIKYSLNRGAQVEIAIFTLLGKPVWRDEFATDADGGRVGYNFVYWNGTNGKGRFVETGAYIIILNATTDDGSRDTAKIKLGAVK